MSYDVIHIVLPGAQVKIIHGIETLTNASRCNCNAHSAAQFCSRMKSMELRTVRHRRASGDGCR